MIIRKLAALTTLALSLGVAQAETTQRSAQNAPLNPTTPPLSVDKTGPQDVEDGAKAMITAAARRIHAGDYDWIEAKRAALFASQELDADGEPQLIWLDQGIAYGLVMLRIGEDEPWSKVNQALDRWQKRYPNSVTVKIARINMRLKQAWDIRGNDSAENTNEADMATFTKEILIAHGELDALAKVAKKEPYLLLLKGELLIPSKERKGEMEALMERAAKNYPAYHDILSRGVMYHMPQWHGTPDSLEQYARRVSSAGPAKDREVIYAKVYWAASVHGYPRALFRQTKADWPTIKAGWEKITTEHPSQHNIQAFLKMACLAPDKETARAQLRKINITTPFIEQIWSKQDFGGCRHWAQEP